MKWYNSIKNYNHSSKIFEPEQLVRIIEEIQILNPDYRCYNETLPSAHNYRIKVPVIKGPMNGLYFQKMIDNWLNKIEMLSNFNHFRILAVQKMVLPLVLKHPDCPKAPSRDNFESDEDFKNAITSYEIDLVKFSNNIINSKEKFVTTFRHYVDAIQKRRQLLHDLCKSSEWTKYKFYMGFFDENFQSNELPSPIQISTQEKWIEYLSKVKNLSTLVISKIERKRQKETSM